MEVPKSPVNVEDEINKARLSSQDFKQFVHEQQQLPTSKMARVTGQSAINPYFDDSRGNSRSTQNLLA